MDQEFEAALFRYLSEQGFPIQTPRKLSGGRSNYVWRDNRFVVKLFEEASANLLFSNSAEDEARILEALSGTGMVPDIVASGRFRGKNWLIYGHVEGQLWTSGTAPVARLLGRLHDQLACEGLPKGPNGSADLEVQTAKILAICGGAEGELIGEKPQGVVPPWDYPCLIHGDPVPANLVEHNSTLTLIDWQCPRIGDPAEDLALFLSPSMQLIYNGKTLPQRDIDAFLSAYPDRRVVARYCALRPWFHWRMAAYCLWREDREAMALEIQSLRSTSPIIP